MIKIDKYNINYKGYNLHKKLLNSLVLSDDLNFKTREELFIKDISKRVKKKQTVLYTLEVDNKAIGFISLSAISIKKQPSLQIDYIFISKPYRGIEIEKLDKCKPFRYLIEFSLDIAKKIQEEIGLCYIVLSPDNDELKLKYEKLNFLHLTDDWMYKKIG